MVTRVGSGRLSLRRRSELAGRSRALRSKSAPGCAVLRERARCRFAGTGASGL